LGGSSIHLLSDSFSLMVTMCRVGCWHGSKVYGVNAAWSGLPKPSDVISLLAYIKTKSTNRAAAKVHFCNCTRSPAADGKLHYRVTVPSQTCWRCMT